MVYRGDFMLKTDEYYMTLALEEAYKAYAANEIPVGCVIVENDEIISKAHNLKEQLQQATAHAEVLAINEASKIKNEWRLNDCTLYVTLEPCAMCASAIVQSRVKRVVIGTLDNKEGAVVSSLHIFENNHNHNLTVSTKVLENESRTIIDKFLKNRR